MSSSSTASIRGPKRRAIRDADAGNLGQFLDRRRPGGSDLGEHAVGAHDDGADSGRTAVASRQRSRRSRNGSRAGAGGASAVGAGPGRRARADRRAAGWVWSVALHTSRRSSRPPRRRRGERDIEEARFLRPASAPFADACGTSPDSTPVTITRGHSRPSAWKVNSSTAFGGRRSNGRFARTQSPNARPAPVGSSSKNSSTARATLAAASSGGPSSSAGCSTSRAQERSRSASRAAVASASALRTSLRDPSGCHGLRAPAATPAAVRSCGPARRCAASGRPSGPPARRRRRPRRPRPDIGGPPRPPPRDAPTGARHRPRATPSAGGDDLRAAAIVDVEAHDLDAREPLLHLRSRSASAPLKP